MSSLSEYIKSLPMPLSKEEQQSLLNIFYSTRKDDIRELLITHNLRLVASCVMKYQGTRNDLEDLMTIGTIELMHILDNKFDITKGISFSTYAIKSIELKLLSEINIKNRSMDAMHQPRQSSVVNHDDEEVEIFDLIPDDTRILDDIIFKDFIYNFYKTLNEEEKFIFDHHLGLKGNEKLTCKAMAKILNKKELVVTSLLQRILQRFRQYYLSGGLFQEKVPSSVLEYLKTCDDPKEKFLLECRYGLNGGKKITIKQIAKTLGLSDSYISHRMAELLKKIGINEEEVVACEDIMRYISTSNNPKEILIAEHTYGLNGKPILSVMEIAKEYGIPYNTVQQSLLRLRKKIIKMKSKEDFTNIL